MKEYIEQVLAPRIQADGGWVEFSSFENGELHLVFRGECSKCNILERCTKWIEQKISEDCDSIVRVVAERRLPFFWDRQA